MTRTNRYSGKYINPTSPQEVNEFHDNDDVDGGPKSHHHTLGTGAGQASPGNHTHDGSDSMVLPGYLQKTELMPGLREFIQSGEFIQTGYEILPGGTGEMVVYFDPPFENVPKIFATTRGRYVAFRQGATESQATIAIRQLDGEIRENDVEFSWLAVDL